MPFPSLKMETQILCVAYREGPCLPPVSTLHTSHLAYSNSLGLPYSGSLFYFLNSHQHSIFSVLGIVLTYSVPATAL